MSRAKIGLRRASSAFRESKVTSDELKDERIGHPITRKRSHFCVLAVHDKMTLRFSKVKFSESFYHALDK